MGQDIPKQPRMYQQIDKKYLSTIFLDQYKGRDIEQKSNLSGYSEFYLQDTNKIKYAFNNLQFTSAEKKSIGTFLGLLLGDVLGVYTKHLNFDINRRTFNKGFNDIAENKNIPQNIQQKSLKRKEGSYNDVQNSQQQKKTSMAKCLAESLLAKNGEFQGKDIRQRFILWWYFGYCNGNYGQISVRLGQNIRDSFKDFLQKREDIVSKGSEDENGNGSLIRLAPAALIYHKTLQETLEVLFQLNYFKLCKLQSLTTHNGKEAYQCSQLLGLIIYKAIHSEYSDCNVFKKKLLDDLGNLFKKECLNSDQYSSVLYLAQSAKEPYDELFRYQENFVKNGKDRDWNWKDKQIHLSPTRSVNSDYYGSYCMDGMYLALHIVYHANSFKEAIFKAANLGGDSDSFGSVVGQIAGAIYGLNNEIIELYKEAPINFDQFHTPYLAYQLCQMEKNQQIQN